MDGKTLERIANAGGDITKVNVLGRDYEIHIRTKNEDAKLEQCSGYCDYSTGEIVIERASDDVMDMRDLEFLKKKIIRHELIHAFAAESGLTDDSDWAMNEEMTDWIAWQFPKMLAAFKTVGAL